MGAYSVFNFGSQRPSPYKVQLSFAGQPLEMEVDTWASLSVISDTQDNCCRLRTNVVPSEEGFNQAGFKEIY